MRRIQIITLFFILAFLFLFYPPWSVQAAPCNSCWGTGTAQEETASCVWNRAFGEYECSKGTRTVSGGGCYFRIAGWTDCQIGGADRACATVETWVTYSAECEITNGGASCTPVGSGSFDPLRSGCGYSTQAVVATITPGPSPTGPPPTDPPAADCSYSCEDSCGENWTQVPGRCDGTKVCCQPPGGNHACSAPYDCIRGVNDCHNANPPMYSCNENGGNCTGAADAWCKANWADAQGRSSCCYGFMPTNTPIPTATPTLYPTAVIGGSLGEYLGAACYPDIASSSSPVINLVPQYPERINKTCQVLQSRPPFSYYLCRLSFLQPGNATDPTPVINQDFSLTVSNGTYSSNGYWTSGVPGACGVYDAVSQKININIATQTVYNKDIIFPLTDPWIKFKNVAFARNPAIDNRIPFNVNKITSTDTDDNRERVLVMSDTGVVSVANAVDMGTGSISNNNWFISQSKMFRFGLQDYLDYAKARKPTVKATGASSTDLSKIETNKVNLWEGDVVINSGNISQFNGKTLVLLVNGDVDLNTIQFTPTNATVAIVANTINFFGTSTTTQEARGIFIGNSIDFGTSTTSLKITGNLVRLTGTTAISRSSPDNSRPSLLIVFDSQPYLDLLSLLSITVYERNSP